jgi:glycoprotein 2-beta-D-xylosyltransferase
MIYRELIWSPEQSKSELDIQQNRMKPPSYFSHFRQHILKEFNIYFEKNLLFNCQNINIFFLLRHDYIAHPRNPTGKLNRKLINEIQILNDLQIKFQNFSTIHFSYNHFEQLSFQQQLQIIIQTDIFIGIHGAGLTHVLFMKSNRFLIELYTIEYQKRTHFKQMSAINNINYHRCLIINGHITTTQTIFDCISKQLFHMCPSL